MFNNKVKPYISVQFSSYPVSYVPAELIPMLVINSRYYNKKRIPTKGRDSLDFVVTDRIQHISPSVQANVIILRNGKLKVAVSCLELARALFLHSPHLTRTAFRPNGLHGMATADETHDISTIRFNRFSDYPLTNLQSNSACQHLIWLMFDPEKRRKALTVFIAVCRKITLTVGHSILLRHR